MQDPRNSTKKQANKSATKQVTKRARTDQKTASDTHYHTNPPTSPSNQPCQSMSQITKTTGNNHEVPKQHSPRDVTLQTQLQARDASDYDDILPDLETWKAIFVKLQRVSEGSLPESSLNPLEAELSSHLQARGYRLEKRQREDSPKRQEEKRECKRTSPEPLLIIHARPAILPETSHKESQQSSSEQPPQQPLVTANRKDDQKTTIETHDCTDLPTSSAYQPTTNRKNDAFYRNRRTLRHAILKATAKVDELAKLELRASTSFMESRKPVFACIEFHHPLNFLEMLDVHLKRVAKEDQVNAATESECFQDVDWAGVNREYWTNIEDFKHSFILKYWDRASQNSLRKKIVSGSYSDEDGSMARYFINLVSQARWLRNRIPDEELICDIMNHFPKQVQIAWYASHKHTVLEVVEFLRKMDEIEMLSDLKEGKSTRTFVRCKYRARVRENVSNGTTSSTSGSLLRVLTPYNLLNNK